MQLRLFNSATSQGGQFKVLIPFTVRRVIWGGGFAWTKARLINCLNKRMHLNCSEPAAEYEVIHEEGESTGAVSAY